MICYKKNGLELCIKKFMTLVFPFSKFFVLSKGKHKKNMFMINNVSIPQMLHYKKILGNTSPPNRPFAKYLQDIISQDLILKMNYRNIMEIVKIQKIVCSTTSKMYVSEKKNIIPAVLALELISGQKPLWTHAKRSLATFKIRENQILGCKVDLRKENLFTFLEKWCRMVIPRIGDLSKMSIFENQAPFSFGIHTVMVFPELEDHFEILENFRGINMNFVVSAKKKKEGLILLSAYQIPSCI